MVATNEIPLLSIVLPLRQHALLTTTLSSLHVNECPCATWNYEKSQKCVFPPINSVAFKPPCDFVVAETPPWINISRDAQKTASIFFVVTLTEISYEAKGIKISRPMCSVRFASSEFLLNLLSQSTRIWSASAACRRIPSNHCHFDKDDVPLI